MQTLPFGQAPSRHFQLRERDAVDAADTVNKIAFALAIGRPVRGHDRGSLRGDHRLAMVPEPRRMLRRQAGPAEQTPPSDHPV